MPPLPVYGERVGVRGGGKKARRRRHVQPSPPTLTIGMEANALPLILSFSPLAGRRDDNIQRSGVAPSPRRRREAPTGSFSPFTGRRRGLRGGGKRARCRRNVQPSPSPNDNHLGQRLAPHPVLLPVKRGEGTLMTDGLCLFPNSKNKRHSSSLSPRKRGEGRGEGRGQEGSMSSDLRDFVALRESSWPTPCPSSCPSPRERGEGTLKTDGLCLFPKLKKLAPFQPPRPAKAGRGQG